MSPLEILFATKLPFISKRRACRQLGLCARSMIYVHSKLPFRDLIHTPMDATSEQALGRTILSLLYGISLKKIHTCPMEAGYGHFDTPVQL